MIETKKRKSVLDEIEDQAKEESITYEAEKPLPIRIREFIEEMGYEFRDNTVRQMFEYRVNKGEWMDLEERHINNIWFQFQMNGKFAGKEKPGIKRLYDYMNTDYFSNRFHPIQHYFNSLKWDGQDHIGELISTVNCDEMALSTTLENKAVWRGTMAEAFALLFRRWLVAAVACGLGHKENQVMLLLSGPQGVYKTTWLNKLCPSVLAANHIFCGHINPVLTDNNTANFLAEKFVLNIDDQLDVLFGKDFTSIKSIITCPFVSNRKAFRRDEKRRTRIANIVGSVNSEQIFVDIHNRRYFTVKILSIDIKKKINYDQVWAHAFHLFKSGEQYWFNKDDEAIMQEINEKFSQIPAELEWFMKMYEPAKPTDFDARFVMPTELLATLQKASGLRMYSKMLNNALHKIGVEQKSARIEGYDTPRWGYSLKPKFELHGNIYQMKSDIPPSQQWKAVKTDDLEDKKPVQGGIDFGKRLRNPKSKNDNEETTSS